MSNVI